MKGQLFRIAHIGFFDYMDTIAIIRSPRASPSPKPNSPSPTSEFGKGLQSPAQKFFAEHAK